MSINKHSMIRILFLQLASGRVSFTFTRLSCYLFTLLLLMATCVQENAEKLRRALDKLNAIYNTVKALQSQLAMLQPRLSMAEQEVHEKMSLITAAKER